MTPPLFTLLNVLTLGGFEALEWLVGVDRVDKRNWIGIGFDGPDKDQVAVWGAVLSS